MTVVHGGNVYETAARLGCSPDDILDYSASINPLGTPPGLLEAIEAGFHRIQHYPDIHNLALIDALADFHGMPRSQVVVGNGSTELIYWLPRALGIRSAVIALPTFGEYGKAFEIQGVRLHKLITKADHCFQPTVEALEAACREASPDAVLLTHPGSPSGVPLARSVRNWLLERTRQDRFVGIVDEVFIDFCEEESLKESLRDTRNLVLIRSMTKFYGVPGLRLGYLLTSEETATRVSATLPPWSVNTLAQIAGPHCLRQQDYQRETLAVIGRERNRIAERLKALKGLEVYPGQANYLLVRLDASLPPVAHLQEALLQSDCILIRDCNSFDGLDDHTFRIAIRLPEQNDRVLDGIARWMAAQAA